jgi:hypothetical protein
MPNAKDGGLQAFDRDRSNAGFRTPLLAFDIVRLIFKWLMEAFCLAKTVLSGIT